MGVQLKSFGHFIPEHRVTNAELASRFSITEEWILQRTGIEERRYFLEGATSDMIVKASISCLTNSNIQPSEIDCLIVATFTPDYHCPSTASIVHQKLGAKNAFGFDIVAACSGFIYALQLGQCLLNSKAYRNVLICAADKMSTVIDKADKKTVLLFGDGAGVALLQYSEKYSDIRDVVCKLNSTGAMDVNMQYGGSAAPVNEGNIKTNKHLLRFYSKGVFNEGISLMEQVIVECLQKNGLSEKDIDFIVPHQANKRMLEILANNLLIPIEKFIINVEKIGNTSAASIPIAISEALEKGKLKGNERLLLVAVGAGYVYSASILTLNVNQLNIL